ncbi:MAG TPA: hypothetical protein DCS97_02450 [Planctomycetes bacterium]|nr:hypothetical protein [Planctomycetota bacterium]
MGGRGTVILAVLAVRDAEWYMALASQPAWPWSRSILLCTNEVAVDLARRRGFEALSVFAAEDELPRALDPVALDAEYAHPPEAQSTAHEETNNALDAHSARLKFWRRFLAFRRLLDPLGAVDVVQELGGFATNLALHAWCQWSGRPELVLEPAPFPGRAIASLNRLLVDLPRTQPPAEAIAAGTAWRDTFLAKPAMLMPEKDRLFFRKAGLAKTFSLDFQRRAWNKVTRRFLLGKREEFSSISVQVREQTMRMLRSRRLRSSYGLPAAGTNFVYYPLHVPWDVQLTFRSPAHFDQIALLGRLIDALPAGWQVVTKEHPAAIGSYPLGGLRRLIAGGRLVLAHPQRNSLDLARQARCVITVNSKVGFECFCAGLPVITLGPSFYRGHDCTIDADDLASAARIASATTGVPPPSTAAVDALLGRIWAASFPCEFYVQRADAIAASASGLAQAATALP